MSDDTAERVDAFVRASKGDKRRALLLALEAGFAFELAVGAMGDEGAHVAFQCLLDGLINCGTLTPEGYTWLRKEMD